MDSKSMNFTKLALPSIMNGDLDKIRKICNEVRYDKFYIDRGLLMACMHGSMASVQLFITEFNADVNFMSGAPLKRAIRVKNYGIIAYLISSGAKISMVFKDKYFSEYQIDDFAMKMITSLAG